MKSYSREAFLTKLQCQRLTDPLDIPIPIITISTTNKKVIIRNPRDDTLKSRDPVNPISEILLNILFCISPC